MTTPEPDFVDLPGFAAIVNIPVNTLKGYRAARQLPPPDLVLGQSWGWRPATARKWAAERELATPAPDYLDNTRAATYVGVERNTWTRYQVEGRTPPPDLTLGNSPGWLTSTLDAWKTDRPGPGARTDLKQKTPTRPTTRKATR